MALALTTACESSHDCAIDEQDNADSTYVAYKTACIGYSRAFCEKNVECLPSGLDCRSAPTVCDRFVQLRAGADPEACFAQIEDVPCELWNTNTEEAFEEKSRLMSACGLFE